MPDRLRHALRFAVATLLAVLAVGVASELVDVYVMGDVAEGMTAAETFRFNAEVWTWIAIAEGVAVFLIRIGDVNPTPPSWLFAGALGLWLAIASLAAAHALEEGRWLLATLGSVFAVGVWFLLHRHIPGWPGPWQARRSPQLGVAGGQAGSPPVSRERELR